VVVVADVGSLGTLDRTGWNPTADGTLALRKLSRLAHVPTSTLVTRIRRSVIRSPFAPAVVLPHPERGLAYFLDERAEQYRGFKVTDSRRGAIRRARSAASSSGCSAK